MLTSITIHSFRSCTNVALTNLGAILMLIGRNGVGKTNILRAVEWAAQAALSTSGIQPDTIVGIGTSHVVFRVRLGGDDLEYGVVSGLNFKQVGGTFEPEIIFREHLSHVDVGGKSRSVFRRDREDLYVGDETKPVKVTAPSGSSSAILSLFPEHEATAVVKRFLDFVRGVKYYPLEELQPKRVSSFVTSSDYAAWRAGNEKTDIAGREPVFQILRLFLDEQETFSEFKSLLGPDGLNIISDIQITDLQFPVPVNGNVDSGEANRVYFVQFRPSSSSPSGLFGYENLSFGTRRILRMMLALLYDKTTVSLVEQPEDGIHSGLLHQFLPLLRAYSNPRQFFVASHSTEVLNRANAEEVRLVDMNNGATSARPLSVPELAAAKKFMQENGPLSDFIESMEA